MKHKLITSVILVCLLLLMISTAVLANDANTFSLTADKDSYTSGDTVVVTASNTSSFAGVEGVLEYDSDVLTYTGVSFADSIKEWNTSYENVRIPANGKVRFSLVGDTDNGTTGDWVSFSFTVNEGEVASITSELILSELKTASVSAELNTASGSPLAININSIKTDIKDASVTLGESITVNYYATLTAQTKDAQMKFTMNEKEVTVDGKLVSGNEYKFAFEGVSPQCMTDAITAQLVDGTEVLDTYDSYSVRAYCDSLLASDAATLGISAEKYEAMKTLVADLLQYGAMAQTYRGYKTDSLANQNITGQREFVALTDDWKAAPNNSGENIKITAGGVWFANVNKIYLKFTTTDINNTTLVFDDVTYTSEHFELVSDNTYIFYSDAISPSEFDNKISAQFKCGEDEASISYCVNSYVYAKQGQDTKMGDLARALYNYGVSAVAYMNAQ